MSVYRAHPGWLAAPVLAPILGAKLLLEADGVGQLLFACAWILALALLLFWGSRFARFEVRDHSISFRNFWGHSQTVSILDIKALHPAPTTRRGFGRTWILQTDTGQHVVQGVHLLAASSRANLGEDLRQTNPEADIGL